MPVNDPFKARATLKTKAGNFTIYRLDALEKAGLCTLSKLPYSIRILLEAVLRHAGHGAVTEEDVRSMAKWSPKAVPEKEVPFMVARVLMQDFTGVPAVVDLAAMRGAMKKLGGDPNRINPLIPTELVIDHSVQVDHFGAKDALERNEKLEFDRNMERYEFLRWGQTAFNNFLVVPPSTGIVHQVNLEYLARVVQTGPDHNGGKDKLAYPDTVVGTDSHTTMVNSMGVMGWGVGGIEAEASMLGQPYYMLAPEVVGMRLEGKLADGVLATDMVLQATQMLRKLGVVNKFVEFYGPGLSSLSLADRATLANMAPEYGATMGFCPVDAQTLAYLRTTGRDEAQIDLVERYLKEQGLFAEAGSPEPEYTASLTLDISSVKANLAGPKRPQDRVPLTEMKPQFRKSFTAPVAERGFNQPVADLSRTAVAKTPQGEVTMGQGAVVIAAITSCTNTSNPSVLIGAGLVAKKAVERGLKVKPFVKTSLAPGSRVVGEYLKAAGLMAPLEQLGFHIVGYGCTTCIGNSGPVPEYVADAVKGADLLVSAVLSGNRNFEGRINPVVKANYLASPPLVVAYALAGSVDLDMATESLGLGKDGKPVFLKDIWPTTAEIESAMSKAIRPDLFKSAYSDVMKANPRWNKIKVAGSELYAWDEKSTYIQEPPYFDNLSLKPGKVGDIQGMRALLVLGDSVTTDHISPAGSIATEGAAGEYLLSRDVSKSQFNSYGARRGNDRVMTRGTFGNIRIKNMLLPGTEGSFTRHLPSGEKMRVYDAALRYRKENVPLMVIGGKEYGTGSSRDWAAKGTMLLGIRVALVESYERIHRSNLVGMGVLPLQFHAGENLASLGLKGDEVFSVEGISDDMAPGIDLTVVAQKADGSTVRFAARSRIDTRVEVNYYRNGGILQTVLRQLVAAG
ncbi:MAG: aconitate hydratase AcnA [Deltaproteobacteria bacterium]|nr:aconitate hydratase AcnA [Deltaproteobacteria bacterium]